MENEIGEDLNKKIGLILEYYANSCYSDNVEKITEEIQKLYDYEEVSPEKIKPLLKELYKKVVKREFHSDLLLEILNEI